MRPFPLQGGEDGRLVLLFDLPERISSRIRQAPRRRPW